MTHTTTKIDGRLPRNIGVAAEAVLASRDQPDQMMRVFDRSLVPMVMVNAGRGYVEANIPARLAFRLSLAELRGYRIDDLTPPHYIQTMNVAWSRLLDTGCVAGPYEVAPPDGSLFAVVYYALANALPGSHVIAFAPAGWPDDELSLEDNTSSPLTAREREVLQLAAEGLSGPRIAKRLVVSPGTVKTHFGNLYEKLGVSDRAAAVARGLRLGLIK